MVVMSRTFRGRSLALRLKLLDHDQPKGVTMQGSARFTVLAVLALCATISFSVGATHAPASGEAASGTGTVNAIMEGKVNISHGPIPALGWPAMTMDFDLANSATTEGIKVGQTVTFQLHKRGDGGYEIESLSPSKD